METSQAPAEPTTSLPARQRCTICADPRLADINASIAAHGLRKTSRDMDISLAALQRHNVNHLLPQRPAQPGAVKNETLRQAEIAERIGLRNARAARRSGDLKASNGAIASLVKAIELGGKARKELLPGTQVNVTLTAVQQTAVDRYSECVKMDTPAITDEAERWLSALVTAGDAHACAAVARLAQQVAQPSSRDA